jgi:hypothetical protein
MNTEAKTSLVSVLYKSREQNTPVVKLVQEIEALLEGTDYTLSRWEANGRGRSRTVSIHWGIHRGPRPDEFRSRDDNLFADWVELEKIEGTTVRCEAYRELQSLRETARELHGAMRPN